LMQRSCK